MASSSSSQQSRARNSGTSTNSKKIIRDSNGTILCKCGTPALVKSSRTPNNLGRKFYGCPFWPDEANCKMIVWLDEVAELERTASEQVVGGNSESELLRLEYKMKKLRYKEEMLRYKEELEGYKREVIA